MRRCKKIVTEEELVTLESDTSAKPRVYYKNNHLFTTCFVGGTIVTRKDDVEDCVEGATVSAMAGDTLLGVATSDAFGEFAIGRIELGIGAITVIVNVDGETVKTVDVDIQDSVYVGCIAV